MLARLASSSRIYPDEIYLTTPIHAGLYKIAAVVSMSSAFDVAAFACIALTFAAAFSAGCNLACERKFVRCWKPGSSMQVFFY
jgi:hypothetical protein